MKKILFLIQWFPSELSANALCDKMIIDEMVKTGDFKIDILAYKSSTNADYEETGAVRVYRFTRSNWWNIIVKAKKSSGTKSRAILKLNKFLLRLKQIITCPIYPIIDIRAIIKFKKKAHNLFIKNRYDLVIAEHHGSDSLLAGYFLKKKYPQLKFLCILWDPISVKLPPKYLPSKYARKRLLALEMNLLKIADKVVAMKSSEKKINEIMHDNILLKKYVFLDIPRIVKPQLIHSSNNKDLILDNKINIIYSGILSLPDRDPEYLIQALNLTQKADNINLIFLTTGEGKDKLIGLKSTFKGNIINSDYIDLAELTNLYNFVDVFINFGGSNPNMVPSKIFEYMSYGKPIISTYNIDDESSKKYFEKYRLAVCIDQRMPLHVSANAIDIFFETCLGEKIEFSEVSKLFMNNTPQVYLSLINQFLE